jgi:hypothetical protein
METKGEITLEEYERKYPEPKDLLSVAKIAKWKPGDGWKVIAELPFIVRLPNGGFFYNESSEGCILLAIQDIIGKEKLKSSLKKAYPEEDWNNYDPEKWRPFLKRKIQPEHWDKLMDDLTDINYHSLRMVLE